MNDRTTRAATLQRILDHRVVAIIRLARPGPIEEIAEALVAGGVVALEVTMTTPGALEAVSACRDRLGSGVVIGVGSVMDAAGARRSLDAGAEFLVSPVVAPDVIDAAHRGDVPAFPGAMTPTEIITARTHGADVVKVFPARSLGPGYVADVLAPIPDIRLMPTGGVDERNAAAFLAAGAAAVAVGGSLVSAATVDQADWARLTRRAARLVASIGG